MDKSALENIFKNNWAYALPHIFSLDRRSRFAFANSENFCPAIL
jgi:hypothetical protein